MEEQEKILNNLNLSGIGDQEVINLYSGVLDEISQIQIADRELTVLQERFRKAVQRQIGTTVLVAAAQMATMQVDGMVRTGVNSWLDYRDLNWAREFDAWKVDKARMTAVVDKSSKFLDTFWKMIKQKNIPDRWLVRGNDLDELEDAFREADLDKRLRILKRMEPYMECYPPYWYLLSRTQQGLGQLDEAARTIDRLADLAHGHFRRDDMLAAALANKAVIMVHLRYPGAAATAQEALRYSPTVWEANLMCAQVLEQAGQIEAAEDAVLRNLDVDLEHSRSVVALFGLYYRQERWNELAAAMAADSLLEGVPVITLAQCAARLGPERAPPAVLQRIRESLRVAIEPRFGADDLLVICGPEWQAEQADVRVDLSGGLRPITAPQRTVHASGETVLRFRGAVEGGSRLYRTAPNLAGTTVVFDFQPRQPVGTQAEPLPPLVVLLGPPLPRDISASPAAPWWPAASPVEVRFGSTQLPLIDGLSSGAGVIAGGAIPPTGPDRTPVTGLPSAGVNPARPSLDVFPEVEGSPAPEGTAEQRQPVAGRPRVTILGVRANEPAGTGPAAPADNQGPPVGPPASPPPVPKSLPAEVPRESAPDAGAEAVPAPPAEGSGS